MSAGYGVDTWCFDSVVTGRLADGVTLVAQALYGRLVTPRGALQGYDDENDAEESVYGFDVSGYVGATGTTVALAALPGLVEGELSKDDRVSTVAVESAIADDGAGGVSITLDIAVELRDAGDSFTLTLSVTEYALTVVGIS